MGHLGEAQLAWLKQDLAGRSSSTPVVVFTHVPMWTVYADWGWGTDDSAQAMALLGRFGSVTVLNGHIHQVIQKVEGNVAFHTARSTAFPQPAPGQGPSPGPLKIPAGELRAALGVRTVTVTRGSHPLAVVDASLAT
jgi:3',5'-cyclic AMP phosphodiesterase CpdA